MAPNRKGKSPCAQSVSLIALGMFAVLSQSAGVQADPQEVILGDVVVITAEVEGIDRVDRTLVLLGPEGNIVAVEVGYGARNFDQIEVGDQIQDRVLRICRGVYRHARKQAGTWCGTRDGKVDKSVKIYDKLKKATWSTSAIRKQSQYQRINGVSSLSETPAMSVPPRVPSFYIFDPPDQNCGIFADVTGEHWLPWLWRKSLSI